MTSRRGPRDFREFTDEAQRAALQRLAAELDELHDLLALGPQFKVRQKTEFLDFLAGFGCAHRVNTASGATVNVRLPSPDARRTGQSCAVIRMYGTGTINWIPTDSSLDGTTGPSALSASPGVYVVMFDGGVWRTWRS